jgi:hypothetical protein
MDSEQRAAVAEIIGVVALAAIAIGLVCLVGAFG